MKHRLKLYVTGRSGRSVRAIETIERICAEELAGAYELQVIDVLEDPEAAERDRVLATPTLLRELPPPLRRIVGDLHHSDQILLGLDLRPSGDTT